MCDEEDGTITESADIGTGYIAILSCSYRNTNSVVGTDVDATVEVCIPQFAHGARQIIRLTRIDWEKIAS